MSVHFKCLEAILFFKNALKNPLQIVAFFLNLVYNYFYNADVRSPRFCGLCGISFFVCKFFLKKIQKFFKRKPPLKIFLGMSLGRFAYLNTPLLFQHRNKLRFLCVI
jgi:hypothetical protein